MLRYAQAFVETLCGLVETADAHNRQSAFYDFGKKIWLSSSQEHIR